MPANCSYPEPHQSSPYAPSHFPEVHKFPCYCCTWTWPIQAPNITCTKSHVPFQCFGRTKGSIEPLGTCICFVTRPVLTGRSCQHLAHIPSWGPPLVDCALLLIHYIRSYLPYLRPFLHPQPEDAPCRADRYRLITDRTAIYRTYTTHQASQYDIISAHLTSPSFKTISLSLRILFNPKLKSSNHKAVAPLLPLTPSLPPPLSLSLPLSLPPPLSLHTSQISLPKFVQHQLRNEHTCILHVAFKLCR